MSTEHGEALKSKVVVLPGQAIPGAQRHSVDFHVDAHKDQPTQSPEKGNGTNDTFA